MISAGIDLAAPVRVRLRYRRGRPRDGRLGDRGRNRGGDGGHRRDGIGVAAAMVAAMTAGHGRPSVERGRRISGGRDDGDRGRAGGCREPCTCPSATPPSACRERGCGAWCGACGPCGGRTTAPSGRLDRRAFRRPRPRREERADDRRASWRPRWLFRPRDLCLRRHSRRRLARSALRLWREWDLRARRRAMEDPFGAGGFVGLELARGPGNAGGHGERDLGAMGVACDQSRTKSIQVPEVRVPA